MRTEIFLLTIALAPAGCAMQPATPSPHNPTLSTAGACTQPQGPVLRAEYCRYPVEVRAFLDDRDTCEHFRDEPWPESDSTEDRARRRRLIEGIRKSCAGTDHALADLLVRYRDDPAVMRLLSGFERDIESDGAP